MIDNVWLRILTSVTLSLLAIVLVILFSVALGKLIAFIIEIRDSREPRKSNIKVDSTRHPYDTEGVLREEYDWVIRCGIIP